MATEKWIDGAVNTFTSLLSGTELNSLANGNAVQLGVQIDNSTNRDMFIELSFIAGGTITTANPAYIGVYFVPLLDDNTNYGDGRFATAAAGPPPACYQIGAFSFNAAASTTVRGGMVGRIPPHTKGKIVIYNQAGATLPASGTTCKYKTFDRAVA